MQTFPQTQKILIADDDADILDAMQLILEMHNYQVETVREGKKVVSKMQTSQPDLVLLDIWMSGVSGLDICQEIKKEKGIQRIPVILVSASGDIRKNSKEVGAADFIAKPFEMEQLVAKVRKYT